jgi:hypothetical protein
VVFAGKDFKAANAVKEIEILAIARSNQRKKRVKIKNN